MVGFIPMINITICVMLMVISKKTVPNCIDTVLIDWLRRVDLNHRPPGYGPDELPLLYPAIICRSQERFHILEGKRGEVKHFTNGYRLFRRNRAHP